jgi:DNA uptake protein ComE-like DNA-binding protein
MNSIKKWIRDIFGFSGNEINGFLILIPLMVLFIFSEPVFSTFFADGPQVRESDEKKLDSLVAFWRDASTDSAKSKVAVKRLPLFPFDPNTAPVEKLELLGFSAPLARRIAAYRLKGGTFRMKSDLMKIYGLDSALYKRLYTFILLPAEQDFKDNNRQFSRRVTKTEPSGKKEVRRIKAFDINMADTTALQEVYGIGPKLAARIIKFRDALGGFIKREQLNEVYGLDSVVVGRILKVCFIEEGFLPAKININVAAEKQLSAHPYIRYKIARELLTYRFQHGDFKDLSDIKNLNMVKPEEFEKFLPYVKLKD